MSPTLTAQPQAPPPRIARITVDQYHRIIKPGILREGDPIELLDGMLVYKDRTTTLRIYAQAGIPQYVVINLVDSQVEVYEQPVPTEGRYARTFAVKAEETVTLQAGASEKLTIPAAQVLP